MSTLSIRATHVPYGWSPLGFARIVSFIEAVLDVLADADRQASAARSPRRLMGRNWHSLGAGRFNRATTASGVKVAQHPQGLTLTPAHDGGAR
jgi:hypothetical protein